jgi:Fe-S cluster assembly ATPase SufC
MGGCSETLASPTQSILDETPFGIDIIILSSVQLKIGLRASQTLSAYGPD